MKRTDEILFALLRRALWGKMPEQGGHDTAEKQGDMTQMPIESADHLSQNDLPPSALEGGARRESDGRAKRSEDYSEANGLQDQSVQCRFYHFVRAYNDTYGMPTIVTNCSNNYGPYQFPEKLIPLSINNIRHRKLLPVYGKGENIRDWLYVEDHARAIDLIFHEGKTAETYNIGGFNEWKNIDLIKVMIKTVDRILGNPEGHSLDLITYVTDRLGHDARYAIDSTKLQKELGGNHPCSSKRVSRRLSDGILTTRSGWTMSPVGTI